MKEFKARFEFVDWDICVIILSKSDKSITKLKKRFNLLDDDVRYINDKLSIEAMNGGVALTNCSSRDVVIILYPQSSEIDMLNTLTHELYHAVRRITDHCEIADHETPAYMTGYLSLVFIPKILNVKTIE
jgi:hypothetical protein